MKKQSRSIRRTAAGALAAVGLATGALVAVPSAAFAAANFTATIAPTTTTAGHNDAYVVTVKNTGLQVINSVSVAVPSGFSVTSGSTSSSALLGVGNTETINFAATAPTVPQTATWVVSATSLIGSAGSVSLPTTVTAAPATKLVYGQQPSNGVVNQAISPPVTVKAEDQFGNVDTTYTAPVALAYGAHPATAGALTGNTANAAHGVATFSALKVPTQGDGYTLVASSGSLTPATSSSFNVDGSVVLCPANQSCNSGNVTDNGVGGNGITTTVDVNANTGTQSDVLTTDVGVLGAMKCTTLGATASTTITTRSKVITYTLSTKNVEASANDENSGIDVSELHQICYGSNKDFVQADHTNAPAGNVYPFEGVLPNCGGGSTFTTAAKPCVHSITPSTNNGSNVDTLTAVIWAAAGDPGASAH